MNANYVVVGTLWATQPAHVYVMSHAARPCIHVVRLGLTHHQHSFNIQTFFSSKLLDFIAGRSKLPAYNTLLLQEHHPVYTVGIRSTDYTEEIEEKLLKTGAEFIKTNRGGLITFHGPGQLVAYPILYLKDFKLSMKCYIDDIEKSVIGMCADFGLKGEKSPLTGVWIGNNKIAAIGEIFWIVKWFLPVNKV